MSDTAPAGWYPDPRDPATEYWWDGTQYTQSRPIETAVPEIPDAPDAYAAAVEDPPAFASPSAAVDYAPGDYAPAANTPAVYTAPTAYAPAAYAQPAYAIAPMYAVPVYGVSPKSRTTATLLSVFLGGLGVDRFYLGNTGLGVAKLLVNWMTFGIWALIDFIIIVAGQAHDGQGLPVTNWN